MPVLNQRSDFPDKPKPGPLQITAPQYRGVTVDTRYTPAKELLAHIGGSAWTINYYSQVLDKDSPVTGFSLTSPAVVQQYALVKDFELRVTTPLSTTEDGENQMVTTGTSRVYPVITPNVGDVFLADIGDGREALFEVTNVNRLSIFKETVHEIEYTMIAYANQQYYDVLAAKTVSTVVFVYDYMQTGQNPLLQEDVYNSLMSLSVQLKRIASVYFDEFVSNEYKTLILPEQLNTVYDPYLTQAVLSFFDTTYSFQIRNIRRLNCDGDDVIKAKTIWDVLTQKNLPLYSRIGTRMGVVHARSFNRNPMFEGVYHSGVYYVAYLKDPVLGIDAKRANCTKTISGDITPPVDTVVPPFLPSIFATDAYVFSDAFYSAERLNLSQLELQTWNYLEDKAMDIPTIVAMASDFFTWGDLERFYYGPVLMILIKAILRST